MQPFIICTAGHIDHGKTALVKALTGTDTDRLKEEKERGITIDLGYAFLNESIAFIDVPGHERFIKNMAAGAATVDFALLAVAADDGIMPQTREHFDILRLLGVSDGVVAITKCDLADEEWINLVEEDIRALTKGSFLDGRPVLRVDSLSGKGIDSLRTALFQPADKKRSVDPGAIFRLPIDRVFSVKGFGTVVTGSALSGTVAVEDKLTLLTQGIEVRVRGIESQGKSLQRAAGGMRVALNLTPVSVEDVSRGDILVTPDRMQPTFMLDTALSILDGSPVSLKQRDRVRVHLGCREIMARTVLIDKDEIRPGESGLVQLRLESMTAAGRLDRFVIRRYSPQVTIGGGQVLDANPQKHKKRDGNHIIHSLKHLGESKGAVLIEGILVKDGWLSLEDLITKAALPAREVEKEIAGLSVDGRILEIEAKGKRQLISVSLLERFEKEIASTLSTFHKNNPLKSGAKKGEILNRFAKILPDFLLRYFVDKARERGTICLKGDDLIALHSFDVKLSAEQQTQMEQVESALLQGGFTPPDLSGLSSLLGADEKYARGIVQLLVDHDKAVGTDGKIFFHKDAVNRGITLLKKEFETKASISMSEFRQLVDTSRKYAMPLLNYYDNRGITLRRDDNRLPGPRLYTPPPAD